MAKSKGPRLEMLEIQMFDLETYQCKNDLVSVPPTASVRDLIVECNLEGCDGFLVIPRKVEDICAYYEDSEDGATNSTGLANELNSDGGVLLQPDGTLASYGLVDAGICKEVWLVPVFADLAKQPTVFKKDLDIYGFGDTVLKYVKLHGEDKELVEARGYFKSILPWLSSTEVSVAFSMNDDFGLPPKTILTAHISKRDCFWLDISCANLAGDVLCTFQQAADDNVVKLELALREKLKWTGAVFWHESEKVAASNLLSSYSLLTIEKASQLDHICGCYQDHKISVGPAGYSSSGTSSSHFVNLEPGRAGLQHHFKGEYKRAEELLQMEMNDASWTIEADSDGKQFVRIAGKSTLNRYWCHERSGHDGTILRNYMCFALVKIPVENFERMQSETFQYTSSPGSGWSCGSENYKCNFFLPMCLVEALRDDAANSLILREVLNSEKSQDYPYNTLSSSINPRMIRHGFLRQLSSKEFAMIKHFRTNLMGSSKAGIADLESLQASAPEEASCDRTEETSDQEEN